MTGAQKNKRFFITAKTDSTLFQLLSEHLPPQTDVGIIISSGGAWKNNLRVTEPADIIHSGETVKVHTSSFQGKFYSLPKEHIIFENPDFMVVYKPCNLNVHGVPSTYSYNLAYGVNQYLQNQGIYFQSTPVTRLDRPVEGLVIFPKNKDSERQLFKAIKRRRIKKWYMAALESADGPQCLRIRDSLSNTGDLTFLDEKGKEADSLFIKTHPKTHSPGQSTVYSVFIFTGRRHQIRFHASHYIAPIIGDSAYGSGVRLGVEDIALVCRGYNIPFRRDVFKIRLPQDYLDRFYEKIEKTRSTGKNVPLNL